MLHSAKLFGLPWTSIDSTCSTLFMWASHRAFGKSVLYGRGSSVSRPLARNGLISATVTNWRWIREARASRLRGRCRVDRWLDAPEKYKRAPDFPEKGGSYDMGGSEGWNRRTGQAAWHVDVGR